MKQPSRIFLIFCVFLVCGKVAAKQPPPTLSRHKRTLIWNDNINWVQMIVGIGLPIEIKDESITLGSVFKAFYLLPTNSSYYTHPTIDYARKKRSPTRWVAYDLLQDYIQRHGHGDGKACLLRAICHASATPFDQNQGLMAELLHAILTPSCTEEGSATNREYHSAEKLGRQVMDCDRLFPECRTNFVQQFTRLSLK